MDTAVILLVISRIFPTVLAVGRKGTGVLERRVVVTSDRVALFARRRARDTPWLVCWSTGPRRNRSLGASTLTGTTRASTRAFHGPTRRRKPIQQEAADDVAAVLGDIATSAPGNDIVELAGPELFRLDELARRVLRAHNDPRRISADVHARYFGAMLDEHSLVPGDNRASPLPSPGLAQRFLGRPPTSRDNVGHTCLREEPNASTLASPPLPSQLAAALAELGEERSAPVGELLYGSAIHMSG